MTQELTVCYRSCVDGAWESFMGFPRRELREAVRCVRSLAHSNALKSPWCLKRKRKVILRMPA